MNRGRIRINQGQQPNSWCRHVLQRDWEMNQVKVNIIKTQVGESLLACRLYVLLRMVRAPQLGSHPQFGTSDNPLVLRKVISVVAGVMVKTRFVNAFCHPNNASLLEQTSIAKPPDHHTQGRLRTESQPSAFRFNLWRQP
jgi:hypothetical protein